MDGAEVLDSTEVYFDGFIGNASSEGRDKKLEHRRSERELIYLDDVAKTAILLHASVINFVSTGSQCRV